MSAIAADEIGCLEAAGVARDVKPGVDLEDVVGDADAVELVGAADGDAAFGEVVDKDALDHALMTDQDEWVDEVYDEGWVVCFASDALQGGGGGSVPEALEILLVSMF